MAVPSEARVASGAPGEATVIDTSAFYNQMYTMQKDIIAEQKKQEEEKKRQNATWNAYMADMPDVWQADYEHVNKALNEYNDYVIDLRSKGIDPNDMDPQVTRKMRELENKVARTASLAKDNEAYSNDIYKLMNGDKEAKYNKDHTTEWMKRYSDPKLTPEERAKMRNEESPVKINYSMIKFVDETIPKPGVTDTGKKKVKSRNPEEHKSVVLDLIMNDPETREKYEALKKPGEDEAAFAERVAKMGQSRWPAEEDLQTGSTGTRKSSTGNGTKTKPPTIKVATKDPEAKYDQNLGINKILLQNTKPVYVNDDEGNRISNFVPSGGFKIRPDGHVEAVGTGKNDKEVEVELTVNYGNNKDQFDVEGYPDMFMEFKNKNTANAGAKTSGGAKTIKRSDISARAKAAGYTDAEYETLLKQKNVTITEG